MCNQDTWEIWLDYNDFMNSGSQPKILIIDDDEELNRLLSSYLKQFGFDVIAAAHPTKGIERLKADQPSLVVLDVMLPERSGFEVCSEIRRVSAIPIIMLTARGDLSDRIVGLELGADDYLPKPYEPRELVARIQSVLRRTQGNLQTNPQGAWRSGELEVECEKALALLDGSPLELTHAEFSVLCFLMLNAGRTVSRDEIYQQIRGGMPWDSVDRSVDMVVSRLRHKLRDDPRRSRYLKTMWGEGYRFVGDVLRA